MTHSIPLLDSLPVWKDLTDYAFRRSTMRIADDFRQDAARLDTLSVTLGGLYADFSKNNIDSTALSLLLRLAADTGFATKRTAFLSGRKINVTENRAVLHTALRAPSGAVIETDGVNIVPGIHDTLDRMVSFATAVREGHWTGHTGKRITDIVNIGIGGSSLGPQLATEALAAFHAPHLRCHFVANVEASDLAMTLAGLDDETTLFIIASKTFTTAETMQNARLARDWLLAAAGGDSAAVARHFVAASTNTAAVTSFGIAADNMFPFSDWVGGRYSVWSSIGLSLMIMIGAGDFRDFLAGARAMDEHFSTAPLDRNIPVLMALIGIWYRNFMNYPAYAVIPYHAQLKRLPAFLQQLDMESNGKAVTADGRAIPYATGPIVFGEPGTDAQHSFFQWLHQSPDVVSVDFIGALQTPYGTAGQQKMLLANMLAQSEALMTGKDGGAEPHRHFTGNRPSTTFLLDSITPGTIGMLLAAYEHKVFTQGAIWGVNSFDQWGVELGKVLAKTIEADFAADTLATHDPSTLALIARVKGSL